MLLLFPLDKDALASPHLIDTEEKKSTGPTDWIDPSPSLIQSLLTFQSKPSGNQIISSHASHRIERLVGQTSEGKGALLLMLMPCPMYSPL